MNNVTNLTQDPWLQRLQLGNDDRERAIEELRTYLVRGLTRSLRNRYGGRAEVEDIAQVALLKILDSLDTFQHRSRFETWAMAIAIRVGMSELRKRYYRDVSIDSLPGGDNSRIDVTDLPASDTEEHADLKRLLALLQRLINEQLTDKQRVVIRGTMEGLPVEVIAARMTTNRNAVYKLAHDARLKLRKALEASGFTAKDISELIN